MQDKHEKKHSITDITYDSVMTVRVRTSVMNKLKRAANLQGMKFPEFMRLRLTELSEGLNSDGK